MSKRDLTRWWGLGDPEARSSNHPMASLHREMDRLFDDFFRSGSLMPGWPELKDEGRLTPRVDVSETESEVQITADMPGMEEKDIEIELRDGALVIKGERKAEEEEKKKEYHRIERAYGMYQRVVPLPCEVVEDKAAASFAKGVLTVRLPKAPSAKEKVRKIAVKAA